MPRRPLKGDEAKDEENKDTGKGPEEELDDKVKRLPSRSYARKSASHNRMTPGKRRR